MLARVGALASAQAAVPVLTAAGWLFWPDDPCRHYRLWFLRPSPEARTHHLHLIEDGHPHAVALVALVAQARRRAGIEPPPRDLLPE